MKAVLRYCLLVVEEGASVRVVLKGHETACMMDMSQTLTSALDCESWIDVIWK